MIPYEDLVIALQAWRARQGLPVGQMSGQLVPPPAVVAPPPMMAMSAPPPKAAPAPAARPAPPRPPSAPAPAPLAPPDEEIEDGSLLEETHYENEGSDFALGFAGVQQDGESTAIGMAPPAPRNSEATLVGHEPDTVDGLPPPPSTSRKRPEEW